MSSNAFSGVIVAIAAMCETRKSRPSAFTISSSFVSLAIAFTSTSGFSPADNSAWKGVVRLRHMSRLLTKRSHRLELPGHLARHKDRRAGSKIILLRRHRLHRNSIISLFNHAQLRIERLRWRNAESTGPPATCAPPEITHTLNNARNSYHLSKPILYLPRKCHVESAHSIPP